MLLALSSLFPILGSIALFYIRFKKRLWRMVFVETVTIITSLAVFSALSKTDDGVYELFRISDAFICAFSVDGACRVFIALAAFLWPFATLYAIEYMAHEKREGMFFVCYTLAYAVTILLAASANLFTMYIFYECLTVVTIPLVGHEQNKESFRAARTYMVYLIGGASIGFAGMIMANLHSAAAFSLGGIMGEGAREILPLRLAYGLAFFGFAAKAAMFPMCRWLPKASVAPTPVTALLHAVAVVNAGVFAVLRITYYVFGLEFMRGTYIQTILVLLSAFSVVYGSMRALRETHVKRRLAWSTVSNLSYMLIGISIMSVNGMTGALLHMVFHGLMKIVLFFTAGAILVKTGCTQTYEMRGLARNMPVTFACFTVCGLALIGVPPLAGFFSKYQLIGAALSENGWQFVVAGASLIVSAILTAIYIFQIALPAYFAKPVHGERLVNHDPGLPMKLAMIVVTIAVVGASLMSGRLMEIISGISSL